MSQAQQPTRDPKIWVQSPRKRAWYWRHPTSSFWKGPKSDRTWVPSIDAPSWLEPPPDDLNNIDDYPEEGETVRTPRPGAVGPASGPPPPQNASAAPPSYAGATAPTTRGNTFPSPAGRANAFAASQSSRIGGTNYVARSDDRDPPSYAVPSYQGYTGPMASTMRYRDQMVHSDSGAPYRRGEGRYDDSYRRGGQSPRHDPEMRHDAPPHHDMGRRTEGRPRGDMRNEYVNSLSSGSHRDDHRAQSQEARDRAWEQALRDRAARSRPAPASAGPAPASAIPNVDIAALDDRGQPILPTAAVGSDESDYGGTTDSEEEEKELKKFRAREQTSPYDGRCLARGTEWPGAPPLSTIGRCRRRTHQ
ncbi:hypothetical protein C8R47DRAFT_1211965 [Mycena vitilis]|nr:hypothetical protein C8R47DRAFT_1211965 [Mycena vitilis]